MRLKLFVRPAQGDERIPVVVEPAEELKSAIRALQKRCLLTQ